VLEGEQGLAHAGDGIARPLTRGLAACPHQLAGLLGGVPAVGVTRERQAGS
jgi:hypothetical protein